MEQWKDIPEWEGYYQASDTGKIRSLDRKTTSRMAFGKLLKGSKQNSGYLTIILNKNGYSKSYLIHRLIAITFIENSSNLEFVNHINGIKTDNNVENLEWCTKSYNLKHAYKNGLKVVTETHLKRLIKFNKETKIIKVNQFNKNGELIATYNSGIEAAEKTGFNYSCIMACAKGTYSNHKTCGGYIWKYT